MGEIPVDLFKVKLPKASASNKDCSTFVSGPPIQTADVAEQHVLIIVVGGGQLHFHQVGKNYPNPW